MPAAAAHTPVKAAPESVKKVTAINTVATSPVAKKKPAKKPVAKAAAKATTKVASKTAPAVTKKPAAKKAKK
ncbi:MAG: hypothetical protein K0R73_711 [Candidatus Midichloriaceae bacterium]|jgi:hypothetical protein|nr:hypothetical protein [Candidatus Midichloriaceae bacterium]